MENPNNILDKKPLGKFVHLRLHTEYSLSDGLLVIPNIFKKAASFNMPALAITDLCNLYATVKFYQEAFQTGIKPIIGIDLWVKSEEEDAKSHRLTLLCQNNTGYKNLLKLVSTSFLQGQQHGRPQVQKQWLEEYAEGLIVLLGLESEFGQGLLTLDNNLVAKNKEFYCKHFPNRLYIELTRVGKQGEQLYLSNALEFAAKEGLPVVATNDVRFLEKDDFEAHEARVCIQQGCTLNDPHRQRIYTEQQYFRSANEMQALFSDIPEALSNTLEIAKRCNVTFTLGNNKLPHFPVPSGYSSEQYLSEIAKHGLQQRLQTLNEATNKIDSHKTNIYEERLNRELEVINNMGFAGYFLIVADFTKWAKENGIPVGPGRGSGPGSLVAYALKITDLDPIALELLFERFLNPERVSMPDFDIDFCMDGRDRVIEYVMQKHGTESVSQIITYGTMAARAVVRDVGRVLGYTYGYVDKIAKLIPFELGITLEKALNQEPILRERYEQEEDVKTLIDLALKLEGITRNVGKHAGGIVIAPGKLTDFVPLYCEENATEHAVTQFDKDDVEAVGLVKFDFLGLKTLTIIDRALQLINKKRRTENLTDIDISLIALNDHSTFQLLKACKSTAVFQLESHGMRDLIKRLQPDVFEDLIALVALFRPGPLQSGMVDDFINRKHGRAKVVYPHSKLEPILRPTYGVILYQEQVMQIAQVLAGYTLGSADILRRAMGKKKPEEMANQREIFCKGAIKNNVSAELANHIFDLMEKFAGYGFNKSHSAAYALIAYQTAWLKTHYAAAFMAAVLSSDMDRTEKILLFLEECRSLGLEVGAPDINKSDYDFKMLDDKHLMYGLGAIKGVGQAAIEAIIAARQSGNFSDLFDFCLRVDMRKVNRRVLEALIKSGSFDTFGETRATLMTSLNVALLQAEQDLHNKTYGQHDLLGMQTTTSKPMYMKIPEWQQSLKLQGEKETLGFYLTGHPLARYRDELKNFTTCRLVDIHPNMQSVRVAGIVTKVKIRQTRRGDKIATFSLDDGSGHLDIVCFSDIFQKHRSLINEDIAIILEGDVSYDDFNHSSRIVGRELYTIDEARARHAKSLQINFTSTNDFDLEAFKRLIAPHLGGSCPVVLRYQCEKIQADIKLGKQWLLKPCEELFNSILNQLSIIHVELLY